MECAQYAGGSGIGGGKGDMQPAQPGPAVHFDPDEVRDYFDRPIVFATVRVAMGDDRRPAEPAVIVRILTHLGLPARAAALTGSAAGPLPGSLILAARTVLQRG